MLGALHSDLGILENHQRRARSGPPEGVGTQTPPAPSRHTLKLQWATISTLDPALDGSLGGGFPVGYITEVAGEAGAGKTQLLLSLLLAVQLPPPHGTGRRALYISTEAPLSTRRLTQMLNHNPLLASLPKGQKPSLDNIISTTTPDLESQEHILTYQVPVQVQRSDIGLIVLDSVAANYRAEFDRTNAGVGGDGGSRLGQGSNMGARSAELVRLGMLLRDLARSHNLAVVVSNQVADRFGVGSPLLSRTQATAPPATQNPKSASVGQRYHGGRVQESPLATRSKTSNPPPLPPIELTSSIAEALPCSSLSSGHEAEGDEQAPPRHTPAPPPNDDMFGPPGPTALNFDHQQRWFTGWGDDPSPATGRGMKTPSLGLVWATQIACRLALFRVPRYGRSRYAGDDDEREAAGVPTLQSWRRWVKVVFAPHVATGGPGLEGAAEFEIGMFGIKGVVREARR